MTLGAVFGPDGTCSPAVVGVEFGCRMFICPQTDSSCADSARVPVSRRTWAIEGLSEAIRRRNQISKFTGGWFQSGTRLAWSD